MSKISDYNASIVDFTCSTIGTAQKRLVDDIIVGNRTAAEGSMFSRFTIKVRSMGTNTYIAVGTLNPGAYRFTAAGQSHTFIAPIINGSVVPLSIHNLNVVGDGATGVLECTVIMIFDQQKEGCKK